MYVPDLVFWCLTQQQLSVEEVGSGHEQFEDITESNWILDELDDIGCEAKQTDFGAFTSRAERM